MKTIAEIKALPDESWIDGFSGEIVAVYPAKKVGRGMVQNAIVKDNTGSMYVGFSGKNNYNQQIHPAGTRLSLTGNGIKFRKDNKSGDGKYDQITVLDAASVQFNGGSPPAQQAQQAAPAGQRQQVQSTEKAEDVAKRLIKEWIQVRKWISIILEEAGLPVDRELVTSIIMGMRNRGFTSIPLDGEFVEWRTVKVNKTPLSEWTSDKMMDLMVMSRRGDEKLEKLKPALGQAMKDLSITDRSLLEHIINKSGVPQQAYEAVLKDKYNVDWSDCTEEQAGKLVLNLDLIDEFKAKQEELAQLESYVEGGEEITIDY